MDAETRTSQFVDYLHGRLDVEHRAQVEALIQRDPEAREEFEFLSFVHESMAHPASSELKEGAFDEIMGRIRSTEPDQLHRQSRAHPAPRAATQAPGNRGGMLGWLFRPSLSYAVAASIFAAQFGVFVFYSQSQEDAGYSELRTQPTIAPAVGPFIRASLKPEAKESEIRFLLVSLGATIVGGPTQLGDYFIYVPAERTDAAAQQMRQSPIVDQVNVIATLPPLKD